MKLTTSRRSALYALLLMTMGSLSLAVHAADGDDAKEALIKIEKALSQALAQNDPKALGKHVSENWRLVDEEGRILTLADVTAAFASGQLKFDTYEAADFQVRLFGSMAVVIGRDKSRGTWNGESFESQHRFTDVFVNEAGQWKLVSSHVSTIKE